MRDYYSILGVERDASESEIRAAYIRLARLYHPDKQAKVGNWKITNERFSAITVAYRTLVDDKKRQDYDNKLRTGWVEEEDAKNIQSENIFKLGIEAYREKNYRRAMSYFRSASKLRPKVAKYYSFLGLAASNLDNLEMAEFNCKKSIELEPNKPDFYINLGIVYKNGGKETESRRQFKKTLKLDPKNLKARKLLDMSGSKKGFFSSLFKK